MGRGPYPSVGQVIKTSLIHAIGDTAAAMTHLYWPYSGTAPTDSILGTMASHIASSWLSYIMQYMTDRCTLTQVDAVDLTSDTAAEGSWSGSNAGTGGTSMPAAGTAAVVKLEIARRYRGGHPRLYLPGIDTSNYQNDAGWTSAFIAAIPTEFGNFLSAVESAMSGSLTLSGLVNVSYFKGFTNVLYPSGRYHAVPAFRATPITDQIINILVNPKFGTQRRRNNQST